MPSIHWLDGTVCAYYVGAILNIRLGFYFWTSIDLTRDFSFKFFKEIL